MPSRFAPRNRLAAVRKRKAEVDLMDPSSSNADFLKELDEEGWKQSRVLRCSYRVYQLIGNATMTEKVIRENLGNNPDTSKALRLLLKRKMIKRVGYGGRSCPFHYQQLAPGEIDESPEEPPKFELPLPLPPPPVPKLRKPSKMVRKEAYEEPHEVLISMPPVAPPQQRIKPKVRPPVKHLQLTLGETSGSGELEEEEEIPVPGWRAVD